MPTAAFFASVRKTLFGGAMQQSAVDTINVLWAQWVDSKVSSLDQFAYVLATDLNELGPDLKSKEESFAYTAARMLQVWPDKFKNLADAETYVGHPEKLANHVYAGIIGNGDEASGDGFRFRGRGPSQLTGRSNYANFGQLFGLDLVANPDLVLDPKIGAKILITGMIDGLFTGKKLSDYFTTTKQDATHARAIVNGDVTANGPRIAGYWRHFREALALTDPAVHAVPATLAPAPVPHPVPTTPAPVAPQPNLLEKINMNISLWGILLKFLPDISALEQDIEMEVKLLSSTADGKAKAIQSIHVLEDMLDRVRSALGDTSDPGLPPSV